MKTILFFLLFALTAFAQTYNVTFPFDSGAVYSDSIQFKDDDQWLSAIFVNDTLDIDTFYIQVAFATSALDTRDSVGGQVIWYYVYEDGTKYVVTGSDTEAAMLSLKPLALYPVNEGTDPREMWVRLVITTDDKEIGPFGIKGITKTFK